MLVSTLLKESKGGTMKAEIFAEGQEFTVKFHTPTGLVKTTVYSNTSLNEVSGIAKAWVENTQVLNG